MAETAVHGEVVGVASGSEASGPRGTRGRVDLVRGLGIAGDARAGNGHAQLQLVADDGSGRGAGAAGEHVLTRGVDLASLAEGRRVRLGADAIIQVTARATGASGTLHARVLRNGSVVAGDTMATDPALDRPRFAVLTLSDRSAEGLRPDASGPLAARILGLALGAEPLALEVLPDDAARLRARLIALADDAVCDLVVTTGGTGLSPRDVTPEATRAVIDREVPGIAEAIRAGSLAKTPFAMLSRAVCGQRGATLILNLSGSPKAVKEQLAIVLPVLGHVLSTASGVTQSCAEVDLRGL